MALIVPEGSVTYLGQMWDGITKQYGLSRDWRFDKGGWMGRWVERIDPLKCIAPWGWKEARAMTYGDWTGGWNSKFREWYATGGAGATNGILFYDGSVYAAATAITTFCGVAEATVTAMPPQVLLSVKQYHPPSGQGVIPQLCLQVPAQWYDGTTWYTASVGLWLPHHCELYNRAMLYCHVGPWSDVVNVLWDSSGFFLSEGPSSGTMSQTAKREVWSLEYLEIWEDSDGYLYAQQEADTTFRASHILVRKGEEQDNWWHYASRSLRLVAGDWRVTVGGAKTWFNVTPIKYSWACPNATGSVVRDAWPLVGRPIPTVPGGDANAWVNAPDYSHLSTQATDWTVTATLDTVTGNRPRVTFTPSGNDQLNRPVTWIVGEQHDAVIGDAVQPADPPTTEGNADLLYLSWSVDKTYQNGQGRCAFRHSDDDAERYGSWQVNAKIRLTAGWQAGAGAGLEAEKIAEAYIKPDGITRGRTGDPETGGAPWMALEYGNFGEVRAARKEIMDLRQAGGMTVQDWAEMIANRMGIPGTELYVEPTTSVLVIPTCEDVPSLPQLAPTDGQTFLGHIKEVEQSAGIRVGFNREIEGTWYVMFVDGGQPAYVDGVSPIALSIDYDTAVEQDILQELTSRPSGDPYRNVVKLKYGRPMKLQVGAERDTAEYYWSEPLATRKLTIGDDWPVVMRDDNAVLPGDVFNQFLDEHYNTWGRLDGRCPARHDLMPDAFIKITHVPGLDIDAGWVYQVVEAALEFQFERAEAELSVKAELVYPRWEGTYYYS